MKSAGAIAIIAHDLTIIVQADGFSQIGTKEVKERVCTFFMTKKAMDPAAGRTKSRNFALRVHRFRCGTIYGTGRLDVCKLRLCIKQEPDWACCESPHDCTSIIDVIQSGETKLSAGGRNI